MSGSAETSRGWWMWEELRPQGLVDSTKNSTCAVQSTERPQGSWVTVPPLGHLGVGFGEAEE